MHSNNSFNDTKDYWGAYYSNIAESATKDILHGMGYYFTDEGKHAGKWVHEKTGKALSTDEAMEIASKKSNNKVEESLFPKDSDRLLREHIRKEYQSRGIYPTSREVQETFNRVLELLEKTSASKRDKILAKMHGTSGTEAGLKLTKQELRRRRAGNSPQDYGDPARTSREEGKRQGRHSSARGKKTKISPSSPARKQSETEVDTRFLMGQGFSPDHLRRIMSDTGR